MRLRESPYYRLMRLHQPIGIWLLLWPCWWSVVLAAGGMPPLTIMALFAIGAVLMRSAGCIINDIADRELDKHVERTRTRPLASGELSVRQAVMLLALLFTLALTLAIALGKMVVLWAVLSVFPVVTYPLMKRISWWPQLFLGLTFNWGALMGWVAVRGEIELPALLIYAGGIFWTLGYDTIYAHQDKADDARIGIKSTALRLGTNTKPALVVFYNVAILCWLAALYTSGLNLPAAALLTVTWMQLMWQVKTVNLDDAASCRTRFVSNAMLGALLCASFWVTR